MIAKLVCFVFRHKYFTAQEFTEYSRRVSCSRCHKSFAMNDDIGSLEPWDADFHRLYESHGIQIRYRHDERL